MIRSAVNLKAIERFAPDVCIMHAEWKNSNCFITEYWCEPGWISHGESCYRVFMQTLDFRTAKEKCESKSATLIMIESEDEMNFLQSLPR